MLCKKNDCYNRIALLEDGSVVRYCEQDDRANATIIPAIFGIYPSIAAMKAEGWTLDPLADDDFTETSEGEWVENSERAKFVVLTASGSGKRRTFALGYDGDGIMVAESYNYTAEELTKEGWKRLPIETPKPPRSVTLAEVREKFGEDVVVE